MPRATQPTFNQDRSFATVRGDKRVRFIQDGNCFNSSKEFVKQANKSWAPIVTKEIVLPEVDEAREETLRRARLVMGEGPEIPEIVQTIRQENLAALAAEQNAD